MDLAERVADAIAKCGLNPPDCAQAAIAAILQEYAIVPKEPTEAMCDNGGKVLLGDANAQTLYTSTAQKCYRAMIAAAPKLESE